MLQNSMFARKHVRMMIRQHHRQTQNNYKELLIFSILLTGQIFCGDNRHFLIYIYTAVKYQFQKKFNQFQQSRPNKHAKKCQYNLLFCLFNYNWKIIVSDYLFLLRCELSAFFLNHCHDNNNYSRICSRGKMPIFLYLARIWFNVSVSKQQVALF